MNQREAVFQTISETLGSITGTVTLTKEQRKTVVDSVAALLSTGKAELSADAKAKYDTPEKLRAYASGLVNNWIRKDKRLNGGQSYTVKNPGSRAGAGDDQLKALKTLRKQVAATNNPQQLAEVDTAIANRQAEITAAKAAQTQKAKPVKMQKTVDLTEVPAELKEALGL